MRILLIGGTGHLGSELSKKLILNGHHLFILSRNIDKLRSIQSPRVSGIPGDLLRVDEFLGRLPGIDLLINVAMPDFKPGPTGKRKFERLRRNVTILFANAIRIAEEKQCPAILTLGASFETGPGEIADETWPITRKGMAAAGMDTDVILEKVKEKGSPPLIEMLPGQIYGPGGLFMTMVNWARSGKGKIIGHGRNCLPRIHVEDCAEAYALAVERMPLGERFILADDSPCTVNEFTEYLSKCFQAPPPRHIPALAVRLFAGKLIYDTVTMNCRVSNSKAKELLGWRLKYPNYKEGLKAVAAELEGWID